MGGIAVNLCSFLIITDVKSIFVEQRKELVKEGRRTKKKEGEKESDKEGEKKGEKRIFSDILIIKMQGKYSGYNKLNALKAEK